MYPSDEHHIQAILAMFEHDATAKYRKGILEHGGHLWEKSGLIDEAINEAIDQVIYLYTLKAQIKHMTTQFETYKQSVLDEAVDK